MMLFTFFYTIKLRVRILSLEKGKNVERGRGKKSS